MPRKKKKIVEEKTVEEKALNLLIRNLSDLCTITKDVWDRSNPMERVMAINLGREKIPFYFQYELLLPEGNVVNGRKKFIFDFFIPSINLVVETDGKVHLDEKQYYMDRDRDNWLVSRGFRVMRFSWDDVMGNNTGWTASGLVNSCIIKNNADMDNLFEEVVEEAGEKK